MKPFSSLFALLLILVISTSSYAQRQMENLNRGLVAVKTSAGVLVQWRILGPEYKDNATYNLYRGSQLIKSDLTVSNYLDTQNNGEKYTVRAVINGTEQGLSKEVAPFDQVFFKFPVRAINGAFDKYEINDASVGDLDGDGEYEIVIKRLSIDATVTATTYHYLEAYKMDGTFMWAINLGPNMINAVEVNFLVYDLDGDGKAEVATRTSDDFTDGAGNKIGDRDNDGKTNYRSTAALNTTYYRIHGPDYISIFEGTTGKEIAWDKYIARDPMVQWGSAGMNDGQLSHRAEKCMWSVAYLDGKNPSFIITRGIYHRIKIEAWDFKNGSLSKRWAYDSDPNGIPTNYSGSGYHNMIVGDIDGDGRDEIIYGSMAVDENGKGIYSTGFGHGDSQHLADIDPDKEGLEHYGCLEGANGSSVPGVLLRNAATGQKQWSLTSSGDIGRCLTADIDENHKGYEFWSSEGSGIYNSKGTKISDSQPTAAGGGSTYNFGIWWDGDVMRELLDRTVITKWNASKQGTDRVATLYNITDVADNNGTKSNPCLTADILGDWREEIIYKSSKNDSIVVFVTPYSTTQRMYTLMHDPNYRTAISWQQNSYNQPPNLSFYFGVGMDTPPAPNMTMIIPTSVALGTPSNQNTSKAKEPVELTANVESSKGISSVTFYATDKATMTMTTLGTDTDAPYSFNWTPSTEGTYYLVAKATEAAGSIINSNIITYNVSEASTEINPMNLTLGGNFNLRQAGDLLYYNTSNAGSHIVLYQINGKILRRQELTSNQGTLALDEMAPNPGLYIAIIEQNGVAKSRLLIEKTR